MEDVEHAAIVRRLPPSKRRVYEAIVEHGPLDDHQLGAIVDPSGVSGFRARRGDLAKMGLVRAVGKASGRTVWDATPPDEVESTREQHKQARPRLRPIQEHPLDVRLNAFLKLADDEEVQEAVNDPQRSAKRQQRARLKAAMARNSRERRDRARELREATEQDLPAAEAMRFRNALHDASELIRGLRLLHDEEHERRTLIGEEAVPDSEWERVLHVLKASIRQHEEAYETIARMINAPSRRAADLELAEGEVIEDAEYELIAALGEDVSDTPSGYEP